MKILLYSLITIFCFFGFCGDEEDNLDECESLYALFDSGGNRISIDCEVHVNIIDTENGNYCNNAYSVVFQKSHCIDGNRSSEMSYDFYGCSESDEVTYFKRIGIGYYSITINYKRDMIFFSLKEGDFKKPATYIIDGSEIARLTDNGRKKGIVLSLKLPDYNDYTFSGYGM